MWFPAHRPIQSLFRVICSGPRKTKQQDKGASVAVTWLYSQFNWSRGREKFEAWNWLVNKQVTVTLCKIIVTQKKRQLRIDSQSVTSGHLRLIKHTNKSIKTTLSGIFFFGGEIGSTQTKWILCTGQSLQTQRVTPLTNGVILRSVMKSQLSMKCLQSTESVRIWLLMAG